MSDLHGLVKGRNLLQQAELTLERAEEAIASSARFELTPELLKELNHAALVDLHSRAGMIRNGGMKIHGSPHEPPHSTQCEGLVDELCDYVNSKWEDSTPEHLAAYVLWRLNWIHPFSDGNGRTSRAASYLVLNVKHGTLLPGKETIPFQIYRDRQPYYEALRAADIVWANGNYVDVSEMETLVLKLLMLQLKSR